MKTRKSRIPIRLNGKYIGTVEGDRFVKHVRGSIHQLRCPPAWAIDCSIIARLKTLGVKWLVIEDVESQATYSCELSRFLEKAFRLNRGFGEQMALPLSGWIYERKGEPVHEMRSDLRRTGQRQAALFDTRWNYER